MKTILKPLRLLAVAAALSTPMVSTPVIARAQMFGDGQDNEKILQGVYAQSRAAARLAIAGKFADALATIEKQIAAMETGMRESDKLQNEYLGKDDDGPRGGEILEKLQKERLELLDITGQSGRSNEEIVYEVWDGQERAKRDFSSANTDFIELARFLATGAARLEAVFGRSANFKNETIPKQGRVETTGGELLKIINRDLTGAKKELEKRGQGVGQGGSTPGATNGKEPTRVERRQLSELLAQMKNSVDSAREPTFGDEQKSLDKLETAADEIEKLLQEYPALKTEPVAKGEGEPSAFTGAQLLARYRKEHSDVVALRAKNAAIEARRRPDLVHHRLGDLEAIYDNDIKLIRTGSGSLSLYLVQSEGLELLTKTQPALAKLKTDLARLYKEAGKTMPANLLVPLQGKIATLKKLVDTRAPKMNFASFGFTQSVGGAAADMKRLTGNVYPNAKFVRAGFNNSGWEILKSEFGITTGRRRDAAILYKLPGEKWHRLHYVSYSQTNISGSDFSGGGAIVWMTFRFQTGK